MKSLQLYTSCLQICLLNLHTHNNWTVGCATNMTPIISYFPLTSYPDVKQRNLHVVYGIPMCLARRALASKDS